ncbi:MAG: hypothetical protein ABIA78_01180 [archaeon]
MKERISKRSLTGILAGIAASILLAITPTSKVHAQGPDEVTYGKSDTTISTQISEKDRQRWCPAYEAEAKRLYNLTSAALRIEEAAKDYIKLCDDKQKSEISPLVDFAQERIKEELDKYLMVREQMKKCGCPGYE